MMSVLLAVNVLLVCAMVLVLTLLVRLSESLAQLRAALLGDDGDRDRLLGRPVDDVLGVRVGAQSVVVAASADCGACHRVLPDLLGRLTEEQLTRLCVVVRTDDEHDSLLAMVGARGVRVLRRAVRTAGDDAYPDVLPAFLAVDEENLVKQVYYSVDELLGAERLVH